MTTASTPRSVLVIEDEADVRHAIRVLLERAGLVALEAADGRSGLRLLHERHPDCIVLDIGLPDLDGWAVLERVRDLSDVPVLVLTARGLESEKVRGLEEGADDYLTKPFGNSELVARIQALIRRAGADRSAEPNPVLTDSLLSIDLASRRVVVAGREVELTPTEFRLLRVLVENVDRVLSPEQLLESAWRDPTATGPERVKFTVLRLRRKLGFDDVNNCPIEAVRGVGYRYVRPT